MEVRFDPVDREVLFEGFGTPEERSRLLATFAREQLAEAQRINRQGAPADVPYTQIVDGRREAAIETVKPDGTIVFDFDLMRGVLEWIGETLAKHSPVRTGRYANSHILLADGVEIALTGPIPPADVYVFVNSQPYARKIEAGLSDQAPDGVYEAVVVLADSRFGNIADLRFGFSELAGQPRSGTKLGRERRSKAGLFRAPNDRRPAIFVRSY